MWGAIVLIDEAEVYLEQRQSKDLMRNALSQVFPVSFQSLSELIIYSSIPSHDGIFSGPIVFGRNFTEISYLRVLQHAFYRQRME